MAKVALLIGGSEYEVGLNPLPAAVKDVVALERVLKDPEMGGFDEVKVLANPDPQSMQYEVETLFSGRSKDDLVLLFFSGHGIKDDSNNLYFATRITRKSAKGDLIRSTAVPARFVHDMLNNSRAKRQAIILDCCFSGAFDPNLMSKDDGSVDLQGQLGAEGRVVLTSSSSTQYSFEQQGSDLSLYTRYLIEGIETGAGDLGEDGKISMRELHEYTTAKVHETAPNMTPKLITLKDMGFDIVLAKAKVTDPRLRYRRQVERYSSRGSISSIGRTILDKLQTQLRISTIVAGEIEAEVLRPYQERLDNLQRYRDAFLEAIQYGYPLNRDAQSELEDFRDIFGLRLEDIESIEKEILEQFDQKSDAKKAAYQQGMQQYELEFRNACDTDYPLSDFERNRLRAFHQSLGLKIENITRIESPILREKEAEYKNQQAEKLGQQQKLEKKDKTSRASEPSISELKDLNDKGDIGIVYYGILGVIVSIFSLIAAPYFIKTTTDPTIKTTTDPTTKAKQSEAKIFTGSMIRAQQAFYTEKGKFASNIQEAGIGIKEEATNYSYKTKAYNSGNYSSASYAISTAISEQSGLKSYIGGVFIVVITTNEATSLAIICESAEPSMSPPPNPVLVGNSPQCASGTTPIQ